VVQGGSTLTQQLVKNYYFSNEVTLTRKFKEMIMAILLEFHYSKDEILQAYFNEVFLGQSGNRAIHGFGLASQYFYGRPLYELDLHELAIQLRPVQRRFLIRVIWAWFVKISVLITYKLI